MTEEVTEAMARLQAWLDEDSQNWGQREKDIDTLLLAMRSASNSPTTNGEVSEPGLVEITRQLRDLAVSVQKRCFPDVPQWRPLDDAFGILSQLDNMTTGLVREGANSTPRAASDDEVERLTAALHRANANCEQFEREWYLRGDKVEELEAKIAALSTPTKASAVDDPETAKGAK